VLPRSTDRTHRNSVGISDLPTKIRTRDLPNTERYCYAFNCVLGLRNLKNFYSFTSRASDAGDARGSKVADSLWGRARVSVCRLQAGGPQPGAQHGVSGRVTARRDTDLAPLGLAQQYQHLVLPHSRTIPSDFCQAHLVSMEPATQYNRPAESHVRFIAPAWLNGRRPRRHSESLSNTDNTAASCSTILLPR
jgi:hypothetical protein